MPATAPTAKHLRPALRQRAATAVRRASSIGEFAEANGISRTTTYNEIRDGKLKTRKIGRRTVILDEDEAAWRASLPTGTSKPEAST